jgi:hypothetical protein
MPVVSWGKLPAVKLRLYSSRLAASPARDLRCQQLVFMRFALLCLLATLAAVPGAATPKAHTVTLGKPVPVKLMVGMAEDKTVDITVRPLYIDGRVKDFTTGETHDVTDHEFVVRRAYRINDMLPEDSRKTPKWVWRRGDWLLVDRRSGKITPLKLPDFDAFYSQVSWYRDYAAYCGIPSSGERVSAVVAEIGARKPLYHKDLGSNTMGDEADSNCLKPHWERQPARVTFFPKMGEKFTVTISGRFVDANAESAPEEQ